MVRPRRGFESLPLGPRRNRLARRSPRRHGGPRGRRGPSHTVVPGVFAYGAAAATLSTMSSAEPAKMPALVRTSTAPTSTRPGAAAGVTTRARKPLTVRRLRAARGRHDDERDARSLRRPVLDPESVADSRARAVRADVSLRAPSGRRSCSWLGRSAVVARRTARVSLAHSLAHESKPSANNNLSNRLKNRHIAPNQLCVMTTTSTESGGTLRLSTAKGESLEPVLPIHETDNERRVRDGYIRWGTRGHARARQTRPEGSVCRDKRARECPTLPPSTALRLPW